MQYILDILNVTSNGNISVEAREVRGDLHSRSRGQSFPLSSGKLALPLPATSEVLIGLDDGAHASPRIVILALNSEYNTSHKVFDAAMLSREALGWFHLISVMGKNENVREGLFLVIGQSTYGSQSFKA
jgi:hypothetical protein